MRICRGDHRWVFTGCMKRIAAAVAVVAFSTSLHACEEAADSRKPRSSPSSTPTESADPEITTGRTTAQNRSAAERAAERAMRGLPLPPGTQRLRRQPVGWPETYTVINSSDRRAYQERWFAVAMPRNEVLEFYVDRHPPGLEHPPGEDPYTDGLGVGLQGNTTFYPRGWKHWRRVSGPAMVLDVATIKDRTVIHAYTQTSARFARTPVNQVTGEVVAVEIRRLRHDPHGKPHVTERTLLKSREPAKLARIVRSFNGLAGGTVTPWIHSCPVIEELSYEVTLYSSEGTLTARTANVYCSRDITLTRDRRTLRATLSPTMRTRDKHRRTRDWFGVLDTVLTSRP